MKAYTPVAVVMIAALYFRVSGLTLNTDDVIRVMTGTGAGWDAPMERPLELVWVG